MASSIIDMPEALSPSHSAVPQTCGASCPLSSYDSPGTSSQPEPSVITPVSHLDSLVHLGKYTAIYHISVSCPSVPTLSIAITDQILASLHFPLISLHGFSFPVLVFLVLFYFMIQFVRSAFSPPTFPNVLPATDFHYIITWYSLS